MEFAHSLIRVCASDAKTKVMKQNDRDQENYTTPRLTTTTTDTEPDYDSILRRRRLSLKGTERLKKIERLAKPPLKMSRPKLAEYIGKLAGVAWGAISIRQLFNLPGKNHRSFGLNTGLYLLGSIITAIFCILSVILSTFLLVMCIIDEIHLIYFWMASVNDAHKDFIANGCPKDSKFLNDNDIHILYPNDMKSPSKWQTGGPLRKICFKLYLTILNVLRRVKIEYNDFTAYLTYKPPLTPINPNDEMYRIDDEHTRFQLSMLFVVENVDFEEFKAALIRRWVLWEPKTRSIVTHRRGRWAWSALESGSFDITQHVKYISVDLRKKSIAEVVSELSTADMPLHLPQWELWFIRGSGESEGVTFLASKWNHVYADGVGVMAGIVNRLGDEPVSIGGLPAHYQRKIPQWQQALYYGYHCLFAATECLQFLIYSSLGIPKYQGLLLNSGFVSESITGVKHFSAPIMVSKKLISSIAEKLQSNAVEQYVNDVLSNKKVGRVPGKPTMNDILCYCLLNGISQLRDPVRLEELVKKMLEIPNQTFAKCANNTIHNRETINIIIPMMCRTSMPQKMDNFTSLVPATLPLPTAQWDDCEGLVGEKKQKKIDIVVDNVYEIKAQIDQLKRQNCRVTLFIIFYTLCKSLPTSISHKLHLLAYRNMQFCSTNVAAPAIEAKFCNKVVHGLFFWPAVPAGSTCGSSWISLGDEVQASTVMDEAELRKAVEIAQRISSEHKARLQEQGLTQFLIEFSDILPRLMEEEIKRLKRIFGL